MGNRKEKGEGTHHSDTGSSQAVDSSNKGRTIRKVMGGGGEFLSRRNFFFSLSMQNN